MSRYENPASTVDLFVEDKEGLLLVKRKYEPFKGHWALPGGYIMPGRENLKEAAVRELEEETHVTARVEDLVLINEYSEPGRDPRGHVISHAYYVLKFGGTLRADDDAEEARKFPLDRLPKLLAFDHGQIISDGLEFKRRHGL